MKRLYILLILIFCSNSHCVFSEAKIILPGVSAISYKLNGGRFGDNLLSFCRAKWLSYTYNIPLLYQPFSYSNQLVLHKAEMLRTQQRCGQFEHIVWLSAHKEYQIHPDAGILYIMKWGTPVAIDWNDQKFIALLKKLIAPRTPITGVAIPSDCISVAVHVRTGGGYYIDDYLRTRMPLRFVPDHFYIDQIKRLVAKFPNKKLFVYVFTDDHNPTALVKRYASAVNSERIEWGYRTHKNRFYTNVLEDFFSMMRFDCLIRPGSQFSRFVERLGNHQVVMYPKHATRKSKKQWAIDTVVIKRKTDTGWMVTKERC